MTPTETFFVVGDRVADRDSDDPPEENAARVRSVVSQPAHAHDIPGIGKTVADVNPEYPRDDPVVRIVFEEALRRYVPVDWESWPPEEFGQRLRTYEVTWNVTVPTYSYPASRLRLAGE